MNCYKNGGCGVYENRSCSECPASKPEYSKRNMEEWIKKSDVLEMLSLPPDILKEHIYELKGIWMDKEECKHEWVFVGASYTDFDIIRYYECSKCGAKDSMSMGI